jgi:hypothetical protein
MVSSSQNNPPFREEKQSPIKLLFPAMFSTFAKAIKSAVYWHQIYPGIEQRMVNRGPKDLLALGLTGRRAEVLYWTTEGKTANPEMAVNPGGLPDTVKKHAAKPLSQTWGANSQLGNPTRAFGSPRRPLIAPRRPRQVRRRQIFLDSPRF